MAEEHGVGLMCRLTLAQGVLTGKFQAGQVVANDHRANISGSERLQRRIEMAEALRPLGVAYDGGMTRMAHHFSLTPQAIMTIIPGARTIAQLEENVEASNGVGLAGDLPDRSKRFVQVGVSGRAGIGTRKDSAACYDAGTGAFLSGGAWVARSPHPAAPPGPHRFASGYAVPLRFLERDRRALEATRQGEAS